MNRDSMTVLAGAAAAAKAYQTEWSADRVADLMDELDDIKATGREVNDLIRLSAARDAPTDEELLAGLDDSLPCAARVSTYDSKAVNDSCRATLDALCAADLSAADSCQLTAPVTASLTPVSEAAIFAAMTAVSSQQAGYTERVEHSSTAIPTRPLSSEAAPASAPISTLS